MVAEKEAEEAGNKKEKPRGGLGKFEEGETGKRGEKKMERKDEGDGGVEEREGLSLEEISKYRQAAQHNSMEAIRAAEERYAKKAKELGTSALENVKETAQQAKEYASQKAVGAKETVASVAERAKDVTVGTAKKVGSYAGEKAVAAKDAVVETGGKSAAGYAAKDEAEDEGEIQANKSDQPKGDTGEQEFGGGKSWAHEAVQRPNETEDFYGGAPEHERREHQGGGGILAAIVETIVEIAQTTKDLVVGQDDQTGVEQRGRGYNCGSMEYIEQEEHQTPEGEGVGGQVS